MQEREAIIYPLFSKPVMALRVDLNNNKILNYIKNIKYRPTQYADGVSLSISNHILDTNKLKKEKDTFFKSIKPYLRAIGYDRKYEIHTSWCSRTKPGSLSQPHMHQNTWLSAVYYPTSHTGFSISFLKSNLNHYKLEYNDKNNIYSAEEYNFQPSTNTLLIFPSELLHRINRNTTKDTRYSLAFSINPIGLFQKGSDVEINYG